MTALTCSVLAVERRRVSKKGFSHEENIHASVQDLHLESSCVGFDERRRDKRKQWRKQ